MKAIVGIAFSYFTQYLPFCWGYLFKLVCQGDCELSTFIISRESDLAFLRKDGQCVFWQKIPNLKCSLEDYHGLAFKVQECKDEYFAETGSFGEDLISNQREM